MAAKYYAKSRIFFCDREGNKVLAQAGEAADPCDEDMARFIDKELLVDAPPPKPVKRTTKG